MGNALVSPPLALRSVAAQQSSRTTYRQPKSRMPLLAIAVAADLISASLHTSCPHASSPHVSQVDQPSGGVRPTPLSSADEEATSADESVASRQRSMLACSDEAFRGWTCRASAHPRDQVWCQSTARLHYMINHQSSTGTRYSPCCCRMRMISPGLGSGPERFAGAALAAPAGAPPLPPPAARPPQPPTGGTS